MKVNRFIQSSDYASLKNDATGSFTLYLGDSGTIAANGIYTYSATYDIGTVNAGIRCQMKTSAVGTIFSSPQLQVTLTATVSGSSFDYPTTVYVERTSATTMTMYCRVWNYAAPYTMQITGKYQTVTAYISSFLSPFN